MKRSRNEEKIATTTTKNDLTPATVATSTGPTQKKRQKVNCFEWLPLEVLEKIVEDVPQDLDKITRSVSRIWGAAIGRRWKARIRNQTRTVIVPLVPPERTYPEDKVGIVMVKPCVEWAIDNHVLCLLTWLIGNLALYRCNNETLRWWVNRACAAKNAKAIVLLSQQGGLRDAVDFNNVLFAAKAGNLECYRLVLGLAGRIGPRREHIYKACRGGHLDTVQWILSHCGSGKEFDLGGRPKFNTCLLNACRGGHKQLVDWLIPHRRDVDKSMVFSSAVFGENLSLTSEYTATAMRHGHLSLAKHLYSHWNCPVGTVVLKEAVYSGNVEGFRFVWDRMRVVYQEEFRIRPWMCVYRRSFDMLDLLAEKDCLRGLDIGMFKRAVRDDEHDLAMLQWLWLHCDQDDIAVDLRADDISCNAVFMKALYSGHVDILNWMQGLGFGWGLTGYGLHSGSRLPMAGSTSVLEILADRFKRSEADGTVWNTTGKHARGPKASLVWLHQQALVDLSETRVLSTGKIWFHFDCDHHQEKTNPGSWICSEIMGYEDTNQCMDDIPWSCSTEKATGEYLIARKRK